MDRETISIALWGDGRVFGKWLEWYCDMGDVFQKLGYKRTHLGITSPSFQGDRILTVARKEKQILQVLKDGEIPEDLMCYSLPKGFRQAAFDYEVDATRAGEYIHLEMNASDFPKIDAEQVIDLLKKYIELDHGEIFQMSRYEVPLLYVAANNPVSMYPSLQIIKRF